MNIMRKLWITSPSHNQDPQQQQQHHHNQEDNMSNQQQQSSSQSISLACMHLRKLYGEYTHTTQDHLIYNMLPIFCKLFNNLSYPELKDRFPETLHFTSSISRLLVLELRKRAGNPSTTEASNAIVTYLYPSSGEPVVDSDGFMLLSTINLLSCTDEQVIEIMCTGNLPSTLVKCLYLFFDLGACGSEEEAESRELVQKVFVQVLIRVCSYSIVSEELCKKDDLALLFSCVSSWCGEGNKSWRKCAGDVLMSVSTHGLGSHMVISYIHNKACIPLCVDNLRRGGGSSSSSSSNNTSDKYTTEALDQPHFLTPVEITESVFTLFCFLKDSSSVSQVLLDDFKSSQGYTFLTELALTLDQQASASQQPQLQIDSLQNLTVLITSLTTYGPTTLKPNPQNITTPFTLPNFSLPSPNHPKPSSIRNPQAFNVLIALFNKQSASTLLPNLVLDSISSIFRADKQNYFIVDSFLPQMAEKLPQKSVETQIKYLNVIEFLVFELNFTPCKELIALSRVLKTDTDDSNSMIMFKLLIVKSLLKILKYSGVFKEAYREIGLLEVAFSSVQISEGEDSRVAAGEDPSTPQTTHLLADLTANLLEMITQLISGNNQNLQIFREHNTAVTLMKLITTAQPDPPPHQNVLTTLSVCFTSQGGEEEFTHALVWMQGQEKPSVIEMLTVFLSCFRESHRARCNFRKAGGFLYLMSLVVGMEGCFQEESEAAVLHVNMKVFQLVFACFGLAMRFEPANAKLFQQEICLPSLADTIRLLSHLTQTATLESPYPLSILEDLSPSPDNRINEFHRIFSQNDLEEITSSPTVPVHIALTLFTYRVLYDLALDNFDRAPTAATTASAAAQPNKYNSSPSSSSSSRRLNLNYSPNNPDPVIVHSGVVIIMIRLLPSIKSVPDDDVGVTDACLCQLYCAELVKSLVRSERNQQIMAGVGICSEIIDRLGEGLCDERAVVHSALQYVFERVGTQALGAGELRKFLRLGNPLNCQKEIHDSLESQIQSASTPVPLSRVKTLVSMTTPRSNTTGNERLISSHHHHVGSPSFVEFDMGAEGFGCLFVPSLGCSGVNYSQDFVVQGASLLGSGIGSSSSSTLGYSTWFSIDKFSDPKQDPHPVRLLSLIKESSNGVQRLCLSVLISSRDKALIVSTKESGLPPPGIGEWEPDIQPHPSPVTQRIFSPELLNESTWTHLILNFHSNNLTVFINGRQVHSAKMDAPQRQKHSTSHTYSAFVGTPPMWRKASRLSWKQGVAHLFEDFVVNGNTGYYVWKLGPGYLGSFQSVRLAEKHSPSDSKLSSSSSTNPTSDYPTTLIPEDKLLLGLNSIAVSSLTLQKIRKLYSKSDAKAIARQLGLSSHENATPIQILHNSSAHLLGPTPRPIGGICIGYLGVRVFNPNPVYKSVFSIGGVRILISLIALANTSETLYASLKALVCVIKNSSVRVDKANAQVIGFVLKSKKSLLSMRVLHLVFSLVDGEVGFGELLGDLEIWTSECDGSGIGDLEKALYDHFVSLLNEDRHAHEYFVRAGVLGSLLNRTAAHTHNSLFQVISLLIRTELVCFGYFVVDTLGGKGVEREGSDGVVIRNKCLQLLHTCMYTGKNLNVGFCEDVINSLGFDFVLLFCGPSLHGETVVWGMRILMMLLNSGHGNRNRFRDLGGGSSSGGGSSGVFRNLLLMQSRSVASEYACLGLKRELSRLESDGGGGGNGDGGRESVSSGGGWKQGKDGGNNSGGSGGGGGGMGKGCGGWVRLSWALCQRIVTEDYCELGVEVWLVICALVLGQGVRSTLGFGGGGKPSSSPSSSSSSAEPPFTLDLIWSYVFPSQQQSTTTTTSLYGKVTLCPDAIITLLTLTRCHIHANRSPDIPNTVTQFLCYLYSNTPEFQCIFTSVDILTGLSLTLVPVESCAFLGDDSVFEDEDTLSTRPVSQLLLGDSPAKKILLDFLRIIIIDWMNGQGGNQKPNQNVVVDTVLDAVASCAVEEAAAVVADFNTRLLGTLLDHLISCDIDRVMGYLNAVAGFLSRLVDKVWLESFERDSIVVMDFLVGVVNAARTRRSVPPATIDSIYNSLNRVILYILSRKHSITNDNNQQQPNNNSSTNPWQIVEVLKKLHTIRTTVFSPHNHAQEFFACLTYVLIQLEQGAPINLEVNSTSKWHVPVETPQKNPSSAEISATACRVWEDVFVSKKPILEELFKVSFPSPDPPQLGVARDMVVDSAVKYWMSYLSNELSSKKSSVSSHQSWEIHTQLQSKIQKVTGGLRSFARSSIRKELSIDKELGGSGAGGDGKLFNKRNLIDSWGDAKRFESIGWRVVFGIKENRRVMERIKENDRVHLKRFVCDSLLPRLEREVTRERGVWGGEGVGELDKWMLDTTEGPCRMRKKLIRNEHFYSHYPHVPQKEQPSSSRPPSTSSISSPCKSPNPATSKSPSFHHYYQHQKNQAPVSRDSFEHYRRHPVVSLFEYYADQDQEEDQVVSRSPLNSTSSSKNNGDEDEVAAAAVVTVDKGDESGSGGGGSSASPQETHSTVLFRLIETECEKISQIFRVAMIQGLDSVEGLLLFGREHFYLVSGFTILTKTREIKDMYYLPSGSYEPILPPQCYGNVCNARVSDKAHDCFKLSYDDVREVLKRRYLLQPIALEIFCSDGRNYLLAFPRKIRNVVFAKFTSASRLSDSGTADARVSVAGQKRTTSVEGAGGLFSSLIGETSVTQRWVRGEISNFQYLMHLNTLAGRSYNDLMQYPVFPWILANYDSPYLDLSDPKTFRDLSKPMGAQTPGRLVQFVKRYKEWDDPHGETPPYHYGTHYSSAMIVCSYLVRMEPFAQHFLRLQGGHFDLADRMFHSIKEAWTSASRHNMADVKELIPEFFYLPDFLKNSNKFDLGLKQNGTPLDDVILPPWAKGDAREFIRVHRMALECDYVSQHLHEWIDLIFGWRQGGVGAVESVNVFHHLFYEGNVDIYSIEDPLKKNATIGFINNFGQIPKQLFKRAHPCKKVFLSGVGGGGRGYSSLLDTSGVLLSALGGGGGSGSSGQGNVISSTVGVLVSGSVVGNFVSGGGGGGSGSGGFERLFYHGIDCLRPTSGVVKELKGPVGQILPLDNNKPNSILAVEQNKQLMSSRFYVSWGFADCSLRVCHVDSDRATVIAELTQNVDWNGEIVACAVANEKVVVTGQTNSVISVWELTTSSSSSSSSLPSTSLPNSAASSNQSSGNASSTNNLNFNQYNSSSHPSLHLKHNLHGHSDSITCLATSPAYNIILSGSKDKTCIVWDLARLAFTRQLVGHGSAVDAVAINECSGDLASADGSVLRVWDINGGVVAVVDTARGCSVQSNVLCVCFSSLNDWDDGNVVVSGGSDGVVRFWSLGFSQVVVGRGSSGSGSGSDDDDDDGGSESDNDGLKRGDVDVDVDGGGKKEREVDPDKDTDSLEEGCGGDVVKMRGGCVGKAKVSNRSSGSFLTPSGGGGGGGSTTAAMMREARRESLRGSRSEGNLQGGSGSGGVDDTGSFEILSEREIDLAFSLAEGCEWRRELVFRGKLTLHTSYGRKDNAEPASITAVGVGRDHKNIYIGDARGRVYGWSVGEHGSVGGRADHWVRDEVAEACTGCSVKFTLTERRHHCRSCGQVFCSKCTRFESEIFRLKILKPVRVCQPCFITLKGMRSASSAATSSNPDNNNASGSHGNSSNNINVLYQQ